MLMRYLAVPIPLLTISTHWQLMKMEVATILKLLSVLRTCVGMVHLEIQQIVLVLLKIQIQILN